MNGNRQRAERLDAALGDLRERVAAAWAVPGVGAPALDSEADRRILDLLLRHAERIAADGGAGGAGAAGGDTVRGAPGPGPDSRRSWPEDPGAPPVDRTLGE